MLCLVPDLGPSTCLGTSDVVHHCVFLRVKAEKGRKDQTLTIPEPNTDTFPVFQRGEHHQRTSTVDTETDPYITSAGEKASTKQRTRFPNYPCYLPPCVPPLPRVCVSARHSLCTQAVSCTPASCLTLDCYTPPCQHTADTSDTHTGRPAQLAIGRARASGCPSAILTWHPASAQPRLLERLPQRRLINRAVPHQQRDFVLQPRARARVRMSCRVLAIAQRSICSVEAVVRR